MLDDKVRAFIDAHKGCDSLFYDDGNVSIGDRRLLCDACDDVYVDVKREQFEDALAYGKQVNADIVDITNY